MKNESFDCGASPLYRNVMSPLSHFISLKSTSVVSKRIEVPVNKRCLLFIKSHSYLFLFIFGLSNNNRIHTANNVKNYPCWDSNSQPFEHESPLITTRAVVLPFVILGQSEVNSDYSIFNIGFRYENKSSKNCTILKKKWF